MDISSFLAGTAAGIALALLAAMIARFLGFTTTVLTPPVLTNASCSGGVIQVSGAASSTCNGLTLAQLFSFVYPSTSSADSSPPPGAISNSTFPISVAASGSSGLVAVWSLYQGYSVPATISYSCSGGSGGSGGPSGSGSSPSPQPMQRLLPLTVNDQLEAIPREYRVSAGSPLGDSSSAGLFGPLIHEREALLKYAPEASTPVEPVWQAANVPGSILCWSLNLLYRHSGVGAVLSALGLVDGREVRFTWVTSDWRFNATNRLAPETSDPAVPALLVSPA